jgi:hypothetical protein
MKQIKDEQVKELKVAGFSDILSRRDFIQNTESGIYGGVNEEGENVMVFVDKGRGMDIRTFQSNGWLQVLDIDENGIIQGELFEGRWDRD